MTTTLRTTTTERTAATKRAPMDKMRKTALTAGVFYLITFISIPTLALYGPVKNHRDWILSSGSHTGVLMGGFLEVIVALAASAPLSRCTRWSSGRTKAPRSASSPPASWKPP